jgi:uncharacterized protein (DUF1800 family)
MVSRTRRAIFSAIPVLLCLCAVAVEKPTAPAPDQRARAIQALNRLTFGPRPGDVDRVLSLGVDKWIGLQLHPESIDDHALESRLAPFRTLQMTPRELAENFPSPAMIRQIANGRAELPQDPYRRAIYQAQLQRFRDKQNDKPDKAGPEKKSNDSEPTDDAASSMIDDGGLAQLEALPPDQRMPVLMKMSPEDQSRLLANLKGPRRAEFLDGMSPVERETVIALGNPQQAVAEDLRQAKILRATYSERQLQEVMTDFWLNHFNVFIGKGAVHYELISYERDVLRPRALGKFEDLLVATAQSPAMLFYLDNWLSVGTNSRRALNAAVPRNNGKGNRPSSGLNENYGRELMELHTLGVNGGYTQKDVTEVAKVFTGWTLSQPRDGGEFRFDDRMHEPGTKTILGHKIKESGEKEGYEVLHILAHHPSTAKFICRKLAMRFVSDNPPPSLVDSMAKVFLEKDGDIREVLRTLFRSPEFWQPDTYRAKIKTPFEFVVSALRATNAEVNDAAVLAGQLQRLGMPLYGAKPPTGYSMNASEWVSSSALLGRVNFALRLASGHIRGVEIRPPASTLSVDSQQLLENLEKDLLAGDVSKQTHDTIATRLNDAQVSQRKLDDPPRPPNVALMQGLLLGSPEFQRR